MCHVVCAVGPAMWGDVGDVGAFTVGAAGADSSAFLGAVLQDTQAAPPSNPRLHRDVIRSELAGELSRVYITPFFFTRV